jgi:hypothetical protein
MNRTHPERSFNRAHLSQIIRVVLSHDVQKCIMGCPSFTNTLSLFYQKSDNALNYLNRSAALHWDRRISGNDEFCSANVRTPSQNQIRKFKAKRESCSENDPLRNIGEMDRRKRFVKPYQPTTMDPFSDVLKSLTSFTLLLSFSSVDITITMPDSVLSRRFFPPSFFRSHVRSFHSKTILVGLWFWRYVADWCRLIRWLQNHSSFSAFSDPIVQFFYSKTILVLRSPTGGRRR